jgi:hypothetical protein
LKADVIPKEEKKKQTDDQFKTVERERERGIGNDWNKSNV